MRRRVVRMHRTGTNVGSAMSVVDILAALYFDVAHVASPSDPERDRIILSKGHAAPALYAALADRGFIDPAELEAYREEGSSLAGHPSRGTAGVEISTGSLGHGLPVAAGMALAAKRAGLSHRIFCVLGDGECQEGSVWEAAALAARLKLDNLVAVVDANGLQGYGRSDEILPRKNLRPAFEAFGWRAVDLDGHDLGALTSALRAAPEQPGAPTAIVAWTIKGKGVRAMEDQLGWHYFNVSEEQLEPFLKEIGGEEE